MSRIRRSKKAVVLSEALERVKKAFPNKYCSVTVEATTYPKDLKNTEIKWRIYVDRGKSVFDIPSFDEALNLMIAKLKPQEKEIPQDAII